MSGKGDIWITVCGGLRCNDTALAPWLLRGKFFMILTPNPAMTPDLFIKGHNRPLIIPLARG
jgi:hypothetical protein